MTVIILYFLILHIIADFYVQTPRISRQKVTDKKALHIHIALYACVLIIPSIITLDVFIIVIAIMASVIHGVIDYAKFLLTHTMSLSERSKLWVFLGDQLLHITSIAIIVIVTTESFDFTGTSFVELGYMLDGYADISLHSILSWFLAILIIIIPSSILVRLILNIFEDKHEDFTNPGMVSAGEFIGILERFIMLILLSMGALAAIGFVLTAKSIARYTKMADEPKFSEYYLIGTLTSALIVLVTYLLLF